jgi:hypothetical protein
VNDLRKKLNPYRFAGMSPFMAAVVGFVLGEAYTDPQIAEITVSEAENLVVHYPGRRRRVRRPPELRRREDGAGLWT